MTPDRSDVYVFDLGGPEPPPAALREAVDGVFSLTGACFSGEKVLIKPNIVAPLPPEAHVTTSPALVRAVVEAVRDAGGRPFVGDNPGGVEGNSLRTAQVTGIAEAAGETFINLSEEVVEVPTRCRFTDKFFISKFILEADRVINLPVFKSHMLTTVTGAVKNCFGYIAGTNKAKLHLAAFSRGRFAELLFDIYSVRPPDLHIVDALYIMEGNGPTHGQVRPFGRLIAGRDGLAIDTVLVRMMGLDPMQVRMFQKAAELEEKEGRRPIGRYRRENVRVLDAAGRPVQVEPISDFVLPGTFGVAPDEQASILQTLGQLRPTVNEDLCVMCGDCAENCPPGAITLDPYPVVDEEKCISCFCCAELCMEGAMEVPTGKASALFDRMFQ